MTAEWWNSLSNWLNNGCVVWTRRAFSWEGYWPQGLLTVTGRVF